MIEKLEITKTVKSWKWEQVQLPNRNTFKIVKKSLFNRKA